MRCWNCGEILDPEIRRRCPYCGKRIRSDEQKYREEKKPEPKRKTEAKSNPDRGATVRKIGIVVIVLAVSSVLGYVICRNVIKSQNAYKETIEQIEACLETEDYLMLSEYAYEYDSHYSGRDEYDSYYPILHTARYYSRIYEDILDYTLAEEEDKDNELRSLVSSLMIYHSSFGDDSYLYYEQYDTPGSRQHIANMQETVNHMLIVYCGFTEEETEQINDMSERELYRIFDSDRSGGKNERDNESTP